jgi:hypothetical protein
MSGPPRYECNRCGEGMYLLEPECGNCGERYAWTYEAPCQSCGETVDYTAGECPACGAALSLWRALELAVLATDGPVAVWKEAVARPTEAGYRPHVGSVHGQWADYRRPVDDGEFHVRSYADRYELHADDVSAVNRPATHLLRYGPTAVTGTGFEIATGLTGALVRSSELATRLLSPATGRTPLGEMSESESRNPGGDSSERQDHTEGSERAGSGDAE